ncbi:hypothetical protein [Cohnella panacarvi]|uniref:hypothetical protein n=1 Tax=Cohnella panacarvi TaxID=400776 RepID=UPI00047CE029|nr:hypothetical protein [Cohnella panacarvi]
MKQQSMKLILSGIFVVVFSGLEKILIFMAYQGQGVRTNTILKDLTPSEIWRIPHFTFALGLLILACGIIPMMSRIGFIRTQIELIRMRNEEFDKRHNHHNQEDNA